MLKSNAECRRDQYIMAARDLNALAMQQGDIGHDTEMDAAEGILDRLRGAMQAYRDDPDGEAG